MTNPLDQLGTLYDPMTHSVLALDGGRDNGILFFATFIAHLEGSDRDLLELTAQLAVTERVKRPGLYYRQPNIEDDNSVDNLTAILYLIDTYNFPGLAEQPYYWATTHGWCWNVKDPEVWSVRFWYWRFIGIPPIVKAVAKLPQTYMDQILWSLATVFCALSPYGNTSDKCLQILDNRIMERRLLALPSLAIKIWQTIMTWKYPGGEQELYSMYFDGRKKGEPISPKHPITKMARKDFK